MRIQDDIMKSLDSHKYVILVVFDLSSAFDSVDHILMNKLYKIGVCGRAYSWVKSYLSSRTQAVEIGEAMSETVYYCILVDFISIFVMLYMYSY